MNKSPAAVEAAGDRGASGPNTLRRGLRVLDALRAAGPEGLHVVEVAQASGIQRSTVYRFLDVLIESGYAMRDPATRRYRLAAGKLGATPDVHAAAVARWSPVLRGISDETGDSAFLICRAGNDSLCLHREVGNYPVQVLAVTVGHRQPLGVGAAGLAFLSALPMQEAAAIVEENAPALRAYGRMTPGRLRQLIDSARGRGWAVVGNSAVPGVIGVGVAIRDADGRPTLAISVSSLVDRMPAARQRRIAELIAQAVRGGRAPA
ncbi:IclR family transcriptional regulator [Bordetella genomosp. 9]|uniref:IclR family transcriptional regulator n=1 Tax=Bordetella genomosp. 9 TaxID=1416803 RepID=UPI000A28FE61|nr:IclR family transcriptional regulator [Bordetella genomosp. 9]ARP91760.1 IclR family transcriptional regulator [Bordetella genomosp. 9]